MTTNKMFRPYLAMLLFIVCGFSGTAQDAQKKTPYYISVNDADGKHIHEISDETLNLQYNDAYGKWKEIPVRILDWKRRQVVTLSLDKSYGMNSVVVNLKDMSEGWEENKVYICEVKNEGGRKYEVPFKLIPPPEKVAPEVSILVNPIEMECNEDLSRNIVEFYGEIDGGKAPYVINWYVMNASRTDFLYQPREEVIERPGKTMSVTVDKDPEYYVVLHVKDACGNAVQKAVNLVCKDNRKKINTIFVEDLGDPSLFDRKSIQ